MEDFNWEDYEEQDDDFGRREGIEEGLKRLQRLLFINDLEKLVNWLLILTPPIKNLCSGKRKVVCTIPFHSKKRGIGFC